MDFDFKLKSAYDSKYFGPDKYRSDSRMKFPKDLESLLTNHKEDCFQLLLHPEHYGKDNFDYLKSVKRHLDFLDINLQDSMLVNSIFVDQFRLGTKRL